MAKKNKCEHKDLDFEIMSIFNYETNDLGFRTIQSATVLRCQNKMCAQIFLYAKEVEKWHREIAGEIMEEARVRNLNSGEIEFLKRCIEPK
jgi:hypothetical protein